jgi:AcrR family transcriptional regulator
MALPESRIALKEGKRRRADDRRELILHAAALYFRRTGYEAASIRDIAKSSGILPGSLYYHFVSKEALFMAVYEEGLRRLQETVEAAAKVGETGWERLESACVAHVETMLGGDDFVQIIDYEFPNRHSKAVQKMMVPLRDKYERLFRDLVDDLPVNPGVDKKYLRLTLLGALAWTLIWYQPGGDAPETIAREMLRLIREGAFTAAPPSGLLARAGSRRTGSAKRNGR